MLLNKLPTFSNCKRIGCEAIATTFFLTSLLASLMSGCSFAQPAGQPSAQRIDQLSVGVLTEPIKVSDLPGFEQDNLKDLDLAIEHQCSLINPPAPWQALCGEFNSARASLKDWVANRFMAWPLLATSGNSKGLITGYYEPLLTGSRVRENQQQTPLYKRPTDLLRLDPATAQPSSRLRARQVEGEFRPYFNRAEIQNNEALRGQELIYLDDAIDAFFLEIQGSGRVQLREPNGQLKTVRVGFSDHNGWGYKAIGQVLIEKKIFLREEINAEKIKQWLRENPGESKQVMQSNDRFIFFTELPEGNALLGPKGALAVPLTAERSVATDPKFAPLGSLMFVATTTPLDAKPLNRFVVSQDIGAAITGQVRADYFFGFGDAAGQKASEMKQPGQLWLLLPIGTRPI
jgi:membrane-bound lytic murein transglycosylase A